MSRRLAVALALALPLAASPAAAAWRATGAPVVTANAAQSNAVTCSDGAGGMYVVWQDARNSTVDLYAQHVLASGDADPAWTANGIVVCNAADTQGRPALLADGAGGAFVSWVDRRSGSFAFYATHLLTTGVDSAWPALGRALVTSLALDKEAQMVRDGGTGVLVLCPVLGSNTDFRVQHVSAAGVLDPNFGANGVVLGSVNYTGGRNESIASDGAGGAIVVWGGTTSAAYAHHVLSTGVKDPAWPAAGRALGTVANGGFANVVADGSGGAIVTWSQQGAVDADLFAQHVLANGTVDAAWPADGLVVSDATNGQQTAWLVTDGAGGAFVAWTDLRSGDFDAYAHHVRANGTTDPAWPADGLALTTLPGTQFTKGIVSDGAGGAIVTWGDTGSNVRGLYALRLTAVGAVAAGWPAGGAWLSALVNDFSNYATSGDAAGRLLIAWHENRLGGVNARDLDVYARRIPVSGTKRLTLTGGTYVAWIAAPESLEVASSQYSMLARLDVTPEDVTDYRYRDTPSSSITDVSVNGVSRGAIPNLSLTNVAQDTEVATGYTTSLFSEITALAGDGAYAAVGWPLTYAKDSVSSLLDELWPTDDRKWRLAHWDPVAGAYQYATESLTRLQPGLGYWLAAKTARSVTVPGRPIPSGVFDVSLLGGANGGWNQIANPYRFPIADTALRVLAGGAPVVFTSGANTYTDATVWDWIGGSSYAPVHTLAPFHSYWVRRTSASGVTLRFPRWTSLGADPTAPSRPADAEWALAITASQGDARTSAVTLGAWRGAAASAPLRRESPPDSPEGGLRLSVADAAATRVREQDAFVGASAPRAWTLELVGAEAPGEVALDMQAFDLPSGITLELRDPALGWSRVVRPGERVMVAATPGARRLTLGAIEGSLPSAGETGPRVLAAWPNPFHGSLGFAAQLAAGGDVRVSIHDVQGRVVRLLERRALPAGESVLVWDGRGADGTPARPGVYLARWSAGAHTGTSRIVKLD